MEKLGNKIRKSSDQVKQIVKKKKEKGKKGHYPNSKQKEACDRRKG